MTDVVYMWDTKLVI